MSARITAPVPGLNGPGVGGLIFKDSVAETDNVAVIEYCTAAGYTVEPVELERAYPEGNPTESWKVDELRRWASDHRVSLGAAKSKADIWSTISGIPPMPVEPPAGTPLTPDELAEVAARDAAAAAAETAGTVPPTPAQS